MDTQESVNKNLQLTDLELQMLKKNIAGEFFSPEATEEERAAMASVIDKANALCDELDAWDDTGTSLMVWYQNQWNTKGRLS